MRRICAPLWALLAAVALLGGAEDARAQQAAPPPAAKPTAIPSSAIPAPLSTTAVVLAVDSDDAEDQAEALTGALRSRVRTAPHWTLNETATSLGLLTAALKCTSKPDAACSAKIADQLKTDHFFWGVMTKTAPNQVTAEVHLWSRGKPEETAKEIFSDNLRDQNDDQLRRIAGKLFEKLVGVTTSGELTVRAGEIDGTLLVDGMPLAQLEHGHATIEVKPGTHVLEVRSEGYVTLRQSMVITPGAELAVDVHLVRAAPPPKPAAPPKPMATRLIVELAAIGVGVGFAVAGTVEAARFLSLQADNKNDHNRLRAPDLCAPTTDPQIQDACTRIGRAESARTLELVFYGIGAVVGGTGLAFLLGDPSIRSGEGEKAARVRLAPRVAPGSSGLSVVGVF